MDLYFLFLRAMTVRYRLFAVDCFFFSPAASSFASTYSSSSNILRTNCTPCMPWCVKHLTNSSLGIILLLYVCKTVLPLEFFIDATKEMQNIFEKFVCCCFHRCTVWLCNNKLSYLVNLSFNPISQQPFICFND